VFIRAFTRQRQKPTLSAWTYKQLKDKNEWLLVIFYLGVIRQLAVVGFLKDVPTINFPKRHGM
jgi:hypothetical protein